MHPDIMHQKETSVINVIQNSLYFLLMSVIDVSPAAILKPLP